MGKDNKEMGLGDFLSLDDRLYPLLGESERKGEHLKLIFALTHTSASNQKGHEDIRPIYQYRGFLFLKDHLDDSFDVDFILSLYGAMVGEEKGEWKCRNTYFERNDGTFYVTTSSEKTPEVMESLCERFSFLNSPKEGEFEEIFKFILHFICIHPFLDGNGRTSAFLLQFLLYKAGLRCAIYLPIDALMNGLYVERTRREIRRASGSFYGMKELDFSSYIPYMKDLLRKSYLYLLDALKLE